jgi:hypothetical protein
LAMPILMMMLTSYKGFYVRFSPAGIHVLHRRIGKPLVLFSASKESLAHISYESGVIS